MLNYFQPSRRKVVLQVVAIIADRNFIRFAELIEETGHEYSELIALKPLVEELTGLDISSRIDLIPPGFFIEDRE